MRRLRFSSGRADETKWSPLGPLLILAMLPCLSCTGTPHETIPADSVRDVAPGEGLLRPIGRIAHQRIDECSGIIWHDGAFFTHNDSGDEAVLYRSERFDFADAEVLPLHGAEAIDWEDITIFEDDLLIGDIGDNRRRRDHLMLYRARYTASRGSDAGCLELIAAYPFRYPDAPHDAEALATIDGALHLISKARDDSLTYIYRFDELTPAARLTPVGMNVPRLVGLLDIGEGEQITAADYDTLSNTLVLLTYTHLLRYPAESITAKPAERTLIAARQCEALCFRGEQLIFTNEQRDVFVIERFIRRHYQRLLPPPDQNASD